MKKLTLLACLVVSLGFAAPAFPFSIIHPQTGECMEVLTPGAANFPGNWAVVAGTPADFPGPWNGHGHSNDNSAHGPVRCPAP